MSDLIDRAALIARCKPEGDLYSEVLESEDLVDILVHIPAVDAVEVVRCKDCKNYSETLTGPLGFGSCKYCIYPTPDDFCSHGERRNGNG